MYNSTLSNLIAGAVSRLEAELELAMPVMSPHIWAWLRQLAGSDQLQDYFQHPLAFPSLLLPWWLDDCLDGVIDETLQADLIYSTLNGYLYIRLIDNVMDGHSTDEPQLLPALGFFHTQFQCTYINYFAPEHPFWPYFQSTWYQSAESAMAEARTPRLDAAQFQQISAKKVCAAKIPLAAVCHFHDRPDMLEPWGRLVDLLGGWHQMHNDLFGWHKDVATGVTTYFLSEAEQRRAPAESVAGWVAREGFAWGMAALAEMMAAVTAHAGALACLELLAYLDTRQQLLDKQRQQAEKGLAALAKLVNATESTPGQGIKGEG